MTETGKAVVPVMVFNGPDGRAYQINQLLSVSYEARVNGKVVLGHPDLKMMLTQIKKGETVEKAQAGG